MPIYHAGGSAAGANGQAAPVRTIRTAETALPGRWQLASAKAPFVGRRRVTQRLAQRYACVAEARRQFVVLCGEPGVGKPGSSASSPAVPNSGPEGP